MTNKYDNGTAVVPSFLCKNPLRRALLLAALLWAAIMPARATDYVIAYTSGSTTYYLGMNNSNQLVATTTFDASCIWTCVGTNNTTANSLVTNYNRRMMNKNNSNYFLYRNNTNISVTTTGSANWRGAAGTSLYHQGNNNYYIHYSGGNLSVSNSTADAFIPYVITSQAQSSATSYELTSFTLSPTAATYYSGDAAKTFTASATATRTTVTVPACSTFTASGTQYYFYNNALYTNTADFGSAGTPAAQTVTYSWSKSSEITSNLTLSATTGASITGSYTPDVAAKTQGTLTVTVNYGGSNTETKTANITLYPPIVAPTIERTGTSVTLATTSADAVIYYTLDGTTPTTASTLYSGPVDISALTFPITVKAIAVRGGAEVSSVATQTIEHPQANAPVITITPSGSTATVTITADAGFTIRYTTDGTMPTESNGTSATTSVTLSGVANLTTIKAYATKADFDPSDVVSDLFVVTGVSGSTVVLDDREDHSWSYYSDTSCPVHRLNPVDLKISYYGYGENTMTSSNTDNMPANNAFDQDVDDNAVQVNVGESGNHFVYYKTLENANDAGTGNYPYTLIPNPFQVRPTYDNNATTKWRGFYAWRVKGMSSGLSIKVGNTTYSSANVAVGIIIYAEQEVEFITSNATGDTVAFEALWARAYVNSNTYVSNSGNYRNAYERNFKVGTTLSTNTNPVTFSTLNPDGSGTLGSVTYNGNYTCTGDVKLENMTLSVNGYIDGNSFNLAIGRGVANGNSNVANSVYGDRTPNSVRGDFTLRVESGRYSNSYLLYSTNSQATNGEFVATTIYGSDYDRASSSNQNTRLVITGPVEVGFNVRCSDADTKIKYSVYSGTFGTSAANQEFYMGFENAGGLSYATRFLDVYGGEFLGGIAGGIEANNTGITANTQIIEMRIHGGIIHRYFYGSGQYSAGYGSRRTVITGGTFDAWIAGGCYGTNNSGGATNGNIYLYYGGRANQTSTAGIYGAGYGNYATGNGYYTVLQSNVVMADEATTAGSVFGGGNNGYATGDIKVYVLGGTVGGDVYGGANEARCGAAVDVIMEGGTIEGSLYGGCNTSGNAAGNVTVTVNGGSVGGAVYGCNNVNGTPQGTVTVTINGSDPTTLDGSGNKVYAIQGVYGGGNQAAYDPATAANGCPQVVVNGCATSIADVFGGGNAAPVPQTDVKIYGGDIGRVFAGGNGVSGTPANVGYNNKLEPTTANSYGSGTATATIYGGTIGQVFGGSNAHGVIRAGTTVTINSDGTCPMQVGEVFGGGNLADSKPAQVNVVCTGEGLIDYVYGGANQADVDGDIELNITGGRIEHVFGGNNLTGTVSGTITVNVDWVEGSCSSNYLGYVYGGGNQAVYTYSSDPVYPQVNIKNGTVTHDVFGGGYGDPNDDTKGVVTGTPKVVIGVETASKQAIVLGRVFGGGNAAKISGSTDVRVLYDSLVKGSIFGGGNAAAVTADTFVLLNHEARCYGNVYGGGNQGAVGGDTKVIINSSK